MHSGYITVSEERLPPYRCPAVTGPACAHVPPYRAAGLSTARWPVRAGRCLRRQGGLRDWFRFTTGGMDAPRTITCASFWDVMVLRHMFVEQGVRVHSPDAGVVALSMVVSGPLDVIKAAAAELTGQYHRSGPVVIEGEDDDEPADDAAYLFADLDSGDA